MIRRGFLGSLLVGLAGLFGRQKAKPDPQSVLNKYLDEVKRWLNHPDFAGRSWEGHVCLMEPYAGGYWPDSGMVITIRMARRGETLPVAPLEPSCVWREGEVLL
jgi:hypothetical protein